MAPNFLALATTLENLGARWLLAKKVNFVPCMYVQQSSKLQESGIFYNPPDTDQWNDMKQRLWFSITIQCET